MFSLCTTTAYTITYDTFGNMVSVSAGGNVLATYTYASGNGKLQKLTYGNGDYEDYTYDNLDRLAKVTYNGSTTDVFTVLYDSNGRLAKAVDGKAGITYLYEYDSLDRLIRAYQKDASGNTTFAVENSYDEYGRSTGSTYVIDGTSRTYSIAYKANTNLVSSYNTPGASFSYNYDSFDRLTAKTNTLFGYTYAYQVNTTLVSSLTVSTNAASTSDVYSYTYNSLGYITNVKKNGTTIASYGYDALGQLVSETNSTAGEIYLYTYDKAGNITKKDIYVGDIGNLTDTVNYTYSTSAWGDLLTNYDGTAITYDSIGNPTKWGDAIALNWDGRNLVKTVFASNNYVNYTYNADGIRTRKYEYNGTGQYYNDHTYVLDGSTIVKEIIAHSSAASGNSTTTLEYYYDDSGIVSVNYNGTLYHYIKNLQGDVIGIVNSSSGALVVEYTYDAWGKILSVTGTMASTLGQYNPFRYRGYYYDGETGLYYLNSRYYDAEVGRFISADSVMASVSTTLDGYNLFAYCFNNPVNMSDTDGHWPKWVSGALNIVSGVAQMATAAAIGAAASWTGVGAVAAGVLIVNGAATIAQGIGQIVNDATDEYVLREDNVVRTGAVYVGDTVGGDTGAVVAGAAYDATIIGCTLYASYVSIPQKTYSPNPQNSGVPFKPGQKGLQYGVDPNTLTPTKDLSTLDPYRLSQAIKYGGDQAIQVGLNGKIYDGHHRVAYAILNGRAVDVFVLPYK